MRSCSSSVLVQETAKQVTPLDAGSVILSDDPEASGRIWRLQSERAMRTMLVVMRHVDSKDLVQVPTPDDEQPSRGTRRGPCESTAPRRRSRWAPAQA